ncbi:MAG TPA: adenosylcobinamide-phosphate synthase CbiB, partial [Rhodocyclaceae bacterium]|nr:adenosylcobinamide-phosphate synthase CbiB [Rhodocyclaceae bacterium]
MLTLSLALSALAAVLLDRLLGEPARWHPLVGFGRLASAVEARWRRTCAVRSSSAPAPHLQKISGIAAWSLVVMPAVVLVAILRSALPLAGQMLLDTLALYFALGAQSLAEHVRRVQADLQRGDLAAARTHVGWIVSRDTAQLDAAGVAKATVETTLENGNDAVFGALFWFVLLGAPGAVLFRLANTLDAMWGYKNERFLHFGWAAARLDDLLNYLPARLTALTYALFGRTGTALRCWRVQAPQWESPNAGPVMAAGAGSLGLELGGAAIYQ